MKKLLCAVLAMLAAGLAAAETLTPEAFLDRVRYPQTGRSMATFC